MPHPHPPPPVATVRPTPQAIDEIELRKEKKRVEKAALDRAREDAAVKAKALTAAATIHNDVVGLAPLVGSPQWLTTPANATSKEGECDLTAAGATVIALIGSGRGRTSPPTFLLHYLDRVGQAHS